MQARCKNQKYCTINYGVSKQRTGGFVPASNQCRRRFEKNEMMCRRYLETRHEYSRKGGGRGAAGYELCNMLFYVYPQASSYLLIVHGELMSGIMGIRFMFQKREKKSNALLTSPIHRTHSYSMPYLVA